MRDSLPETARRYGNARLAYHAARQLNPAANDWFREAGPAAQNAETQAWRVRAALRAVAWDDVLVAIDAMPEAQRQEAAWRYWRGRALAENGKRDDATALYTALARETHFYGILAGEAIGQRFVLPTSAVVPPPPEALVAFGARPEVKRVAKLAELEMRPESLREWQYIVRGLDDDALLLAAEHARRVGLYDRAINTAERTASRHDYALRYLAPFRPQFETAAKAHDIDMALLYGIARQESRFIADIVSSAGAVGLMQLMPGTARWVAKQVGRNDYSPALIADTELNTNFGAFYFKYWFERLERMPALAAAAYNAGPGRAQAWRPNAPLEGAIWVETIPFNETRDYVKKVLANSLVYAHAFNAVAPPLTTSLGVVQPRGGQPASVTRRRRHFAVMPRRVLVLGGGGFVGRHLVARLVAGGHRVVVPTRRREAVRHLILLPTVDVVEVGHPRSAGARASRRRCRCRGQPGGPAQRVGRRHVRACACRACAQGRRRVPRGQGRGAGAHERAGRRSRGSVALPADQGRSGSDRGGFGACVDDLPAVGHLRSRGLRS